MASSSPISPGTAEKDLYLGSGWVTKAYVHIKRKREEELKTEDKVIVDVRTGKLDPSVGEKAQASEKWESRPAGIWIKRSLKRHASDLKAVVTDILFGADAVEPRPGWELVKNGGALHSETSKASTDPRLSIRRGPAAKLEKPRPRIQNHADIRLRGISALASSLLRVLDDEKPDFVVLSGDQVNGDTAPDVQSALFEIVDPLAERKIPYAAIFGNHDDEGTLSRHAQMDLYDSPTLLHETHYRGYDWLKPNQIDWFKVTAEGLKEAHSHYTHKHLNMAFIHIPLPEYGNPDNERVGKLD
ncbi:unnamed protein product [Alternaria alternata]